MNMNFDVNQVFQNRLAASLGLDKYQYIMDRVKKTDVSKDSDFQKSFNGFYLSGEMKPGETYIMSIFNE